MGFFDRFRRRDSDGYEYPEGVPVRDRVDRDYVTERRNDSGWLLPLLLIPAIALVGLGGYQLYRNYTAGQGTINPATNNRQVDTNAGVGVGGAPDSTATPRPTNENANSANSPTPTRTPTGSASGQTNTGGATVTDNNGGQQGVGGSGAEDELTPNNAPSTGRGE